MELLKVAKPKDIRVQEPITIISDPGIDDIIALGLLARLTPQVSHTLISTFGNAEELITARNAREFIAAFAPHWQYKKGSETPLSGHVERPWPDYFHGPDGVWDIHPNVDSLSVSENEDTSLPNFEVISLGPTTDLINNVFSVRDGSTQIVTVMGGAFNIEGNETPYAETNIAFDPDAAALFFKTIGNKAKEIRIVPLDVTRKVAWDIDTVRSIPDTSEHNRYFKKLLLRWFEKYSHEREEAFNLHDPLAVYLHLFPQKAQWLISGVNVLTEGPKRGQTIFDSKGKPYKIALDLNNPSGISKDIFQLLFS